MQIVENNENFEFAESGKVTPQLLTSYILLRLNVY